MAWPPYSLRDSDLARGLKKLGTPALWAGGESSMAALPQLKHTQLGEVTADQILKLSHTQLWPYLF